MQVNVNCRRESEDGSLFTGEIIVGDSVISFEARNPFAPDFAGFELHFITQERGTIALKTSEEIISALTGPDGGVFGYLGSIVKKAVNLVGVPNDKGAHLALDSDQNIVGIHERGGPNGALVIQEGDHPEALAVLQKWLNESVAA